MPATQKAQAGSVEDEQRAGEPHELGVRDERQGSCRQCTTMYSHVVNAGGWRVAEHEVAKDREARGPRW